MQTTGLGFLEAGSELAGVGLEGLAVGGLEVLEGLAVEVGLAGGGIAGLAVKDVPD